MEGQIGELIDATMSLQPKPSGCALTLSQRGLINDVVSRYGTFDNILALFAPRYQQQYVADVERCYFGHAPSLTALRLAYGDTAPVEWLTYQIIDLNRFSNCRPMTDHQVRELASIITKEYYFLKLTELMDFFYRVKSCEYGKLFYGSVDPMEVIVALRRYADDRAEIIRRKEEADDRAEREREREARRANALKPAEIQALRERLQAKWAEEEKQNKTKEQQI